MANKVTRFIKKLGKSFRLAIKGEVEEIITLKPTQEDFEQGEKLAVLAVSALAAMGIPMAAIGTKIIAKALAYGIRDLKDGIEDRNKLIISRVIEEMKK